LAQEVWLSAAMTDADVAKLVQVLNEFRAPGATKLQRVRSDLIVPDTTNRESTGLSAEHMHYLATVFTTEGFRPRTGDVGHDVPVLIAEPAQPSALGADSLARWRAACDENPGYPQCRVAEGPFYCSLGNGHFSQALNLCRWQCSSIFVAEPYVIDEKKNPNLAVAVHRGVPALVLRNDLTWQQRKFISILLNKTQVQRWTVAADGRVCELPEKSLRAATMFESLSKELDADALSALVRQKLAQKAYGSVIVTKREKNKIDSERAKL